LFGTVSSYEDKLIKKEAQQLERLKRQFAKELKTLIDNEISKQKQE
jgi:hypothetical protein